MAICVLGLSCVDVCIYTYKKQIGISAHESTSHMIIWYLHICIHVYTYIYIYIYYIYTWIYVCIYIYITTLFNMIHPVPFHYNHHCHRFPGQRLQVRHLGGHEETTAAGAPWLLKSHPQWIYHRMNIKIPSCTTSWCLWKTTFLFTMCKSSLNHMLMMIIPKPQT